MSSSSGSTLLVKTTAILLVVLIVALAAAYIQLSNNIQNINRKIGSIQGQVQKLGSTQNTSQSQLSTLEEKIRELSEQISQLQEAQKNNTGSLNSKIAALAENITTLQARLAMLEAMQANTTSNLSARLASLEAELNTLQNQLSRLQAEYENRMFPATITDATGDTVVVESRPERIVALAPSVVEILYYINATDRLVGVTQYTDWPPSVVNAIHNGTIQVVGGYWNPSLEKILSLNPDLVIGVANVPSQAQIKKELKAYGIPMILLPQSTIQDIGRALIMAGEATGNIAQAARAASEFESHIMSIKIAGEKVQSRETVAIVVWVNPIIIAGNGTFQGDAISWIGAVNAFNNMTGWKPISPEQLLEAKPQVIILDGIPVENFTSYLNSTLGANATMQIPAIAEGRVYSIMPPLTDIMSRPSPRFAYALLVLQYIVYPEIYNETVQSVPHTISTIPNIAWPAP